MGPHGILYPTNLDSSVTLSIVKLSNVHLKAIVLKDYPKTYVSSFIMCKKDN